MKNSINSLIHNKTKKTYDQLRKNKIIIIFVLMECKTNLLSNSIFDIVYLKLNMFVSMP